MKVTSSEVRVPMGKASDILGIHPNTLRKWADDGKIPSYRLEGGQRRFKLADLENYVKERSR